VHSPNQNWRERLAALADQEIISLPKLVNAGLARADAAIVPKIRRPSGSNANRLHGSM